MREGMPYKLRFTGSELPRENGHFAYFLELVKELGEMVIHSRLCIYGLELTEEGKANTPKQGTITLSQ